MTVSNGLVTLADMINFMPNSTNVLTTLLEQAIEAASTAICTHKGHFRPFYPIVQSRQYDIPTSRELALRADLLELLTITNGDGQVLPNTEYRSEPVNLYPKNAIMLNSMTAVYWMQSVTTGSENAIAVNGIWGYHAYYPQAWGLASTLSAAINASTTTIPVTSSATYSAGQIVRCDNELMLITVVATNSLTVTRAWNESTAAAHDILASLPIWKTQSDIARACMIQTARYYRRNEAVFGTTGGGEMGVQPVAIPTLDPDVAEIMEPYVMRW